MVDDYFFKQEQKRKHTAALKKFYKILFYCCSLVLFILLTWSIGRGYYRTYSLEGEVIAAFPSKIVVQDTMGQKWVFCTSSFEGGNKVLLIFDDNKTKNNRTDDKLIRIKLIKENK